MIASLLKRKITGDLVFLYLAFFAGFVLPVLTIPYLTRVLGKDAWSRLVFVQSFCQLLAVPLTWGFGFHGARLIARHRDDREKVRGICAEIMAARLLLLLPVALLLLACIRWIPNLRGDIRLPLLGFTTTVLSTFNTGWILQGLDRMRAASMQDLVGKIVATLPIFFCVFSPADSYRVLLLQAVGALISLMLGYLAIRGEVPFEARLTRSLPAVYKESAGMFLFSLSAAVMNQTNVFLFGLLSPLSTVGIYAGAEKIIRAACALVGPFCTALHTKINYRIGKDRAAGARLFLQGTALLLILAVALAVILWFASDFLVTRLLGPEFRESASVVRLLAVLPVMNWIIYSINLNWFIVLRLDFLLNMAVLAAAITAVISACVLVPRFALTGMGATALCAEFTMLAGLLKIMARADRNPLRIVFQTGGNTHDKVG